MMDALVSNKPEFVRLFVDNGADVADFLTYGRLQQLYRSVAPASPLFHLLRRKHEEGRLTLAGLGAQQARESHRVGLSGPQFKSSFLYSLTLTSKRDYWKNHSFD